MSDNNGERRVDWPTVFAEARSGVLSKGEVCRRYGIDRQRLETQLAKNGISWGDLLPQVQQYTRSATVKLLSDDEIASSAGIRSAEMIKSHLTLTRGLHARLANLVDKYDDLFADAVIVDERGNKVINPKAILMSAQVLDGLSKIADRISAMEMRTLGVTLIQPPVEQSADVDQLPEGDVDASMTYQRIMLGKD